MKLTPKEQQQLVATFRGIRESMDHADQASAELVASMFGVKPSDVLRLAFFDGNEPPTPPASRARLRLIRREEVA